jgi:hypothetical protein
MLVDRFLVEAGMPLSVKDAAKRYARAVADPGEPVLEAPPEQHRNVGMQAAFDAESQFAPTGNRRNNGNVMDR